MAGDAVGTDILKQVKDELGAFGAKQVERMKANEAKVEELFVQLQKLSGSLGERARAKYFGALAAGKPEIMEAGESIEAFIERLQTSQVSFKNQRKGLKAARMFHALGAAVAMGRQATFENAIDVARSWEDTELAGLFEESRDLRAKLGSSDKNERARAQRSLSTTTVGAGAGFVQPELAQEIIDILLPLAVVRSMGCRTLPMSSGILDMPYIQNAATASYVGEGTGVNASQPVEGRLQFVRKTMQAVVAITKELLRESSYEVDAFILAQIARVIGVREDLAFMRGDGTAGTPRGITFWAAQSSNGGGAHSFARSLVGGVPTVDSITKDALQALNRLESSNIPMRSPGWIISPRDFYGLVKLRNSTTQMPIWPELLAGSWYGIDMKRSVQLPTTLAGDGLGTGTGNKAELLCADFDSLVIAETKSLELQAFDGGAYKDSTGTLQSGITNREVVITGDLGHDFGSMYRGDDCVAITSIDWGG